MSDGMIDEVEKMCNLSYWYEEHGEERGFAKGVIEGHKEGLEEGRKKGRTQGTIEDKYASISKIMKSLKTDFTSAANILEIPDSERDMYESLVLGKVRIEDIIKNID